MNATQNPPGESRHKLLTVKAAAELLTVSDETVREWYHCGKLKGVRIGYGIRIYAVAVSAMLAPDTVTAEGGAE